MNGTHVGPFVALAARAGAILFSCSDEDAVRLALEVRDDLVDRGLPIVPMSVLSGMQVRVSEQNRERQPRLRVVKGGMR